MRLFVGSLLTWGVLLFVGLPYWHASSSSIPPPPQSRADRFGIYNWNVDDRAYDTASHDRLNWGADSVAATGSKTIRVYLGPRDIYHLKMDGPLGATNLAGLAASPAYDRLFRDQRFSTYLLTTYSYRSLQNPWADGFTDVEYEGERTELRALGEYLVSNPAFTGKTFILLNWEGDNEMIGLTPKQSIWNAYQRSVEARVDAVRDARLFATQNVKLFSGLEFNLVRSLRTNQACGTPVGDPVNQDPLANRCVIDYIAPRVSVDYYSYSAWQSITTVYFNPARSLLAELKSDLGIARALVQSTRPDVTEANFIIGEYGFERARFGECRAADLVRQMFEALEGTSGIGVSYAISWQVIDNANLYGLIDDRFGFFKTVASAPGPGLSWTLPGTAFRKAIAGENWTIPQGCPPDSWGVVDANTDLPEFRLEPDSVLSITADSPFSPSGNTVHFAQSGMKAALTKANGGLTSESSSEIIGSIPQKRHPGEAWIYVSSSSAIDSNAQIVTLECSSCPKIEDTCGIVDRKCQTATFEPGTVISLRGSFSPQGNTVIVEQQLESGVRVQTPLTHDIHWSESATEVTAALPMSLIRNSDAGIWVVDNEGRPSSSRAMFIQLACVDCGPTLSKCLSNVGELHPGTFLSMQGHFPKPGNRVVIEQRDQQSNLITYSLSSGARGWKENDSKIEVALPALIQSGHALAYVIDSAGKESSALEFMVTPATVAVVSAASYRAESATPGGIVAAFGSDLANGTTIAGTLPLPTELGGTMVAIKDSLGVERAAPLFFASREQVNFLVPSPTALGPAVITVTSGNGTLSTLATSIVPVAPGMFSANSDAEGAPAGTFILVGADASQTQASAAVIDSISGRYVPNQVAFGPEPAQLFLVLYGTGIRMVSKQSAVQVRVGGLAAQVTYAGPQDAFAGLDQINVLLPRTLVGRGLVDVEVIVDGQAANSLRINIK